MALRDRTEIQALLKLAAEQRRRIKELQASLEQLNKRLGRIWAKADNEPDPRSGKVTKASRKK